MHVVVLSDGYPPWDPGGAQRIAAQLAEGYREAGLEVTVITSTTDKQADGLTHAEGIPVHRLHAPRPQRLLGYLSVCNPLLAPRVAKLLAWLDPDVVHAHNVHWLSKQSLQAAKRLGIPVMKTYHDAGTFAYGEFTQHVPSKQDTADHRAPTEAYRADPLEQLRSEALAWFPLRNLLNRRYLNRCVDVGVAVSHVLRRALCANGMPCDRVVHNGIDPRRLQTSIGEDAIRERFELGEGGLVLFGGRTGYNKGAHHLARALARLTERIDVPPRLVVTGDDGYVDHMRSVAGEAGERIVATGWVSGEQLAALLRAATVVATPSVHLDPFPTVNLEALAVGTPVVTTCYGGARELVRDGVGGRIVDPFDPEALTEALASFLRDPAWAAKVGQAGRARVLEDFSLEQQVEAYLSVVEQATGRELDGSLARPSSRVDADILAHRR